MRTVYASHRPALLVALLAAGCQGVLGEGGHLEAADDAAIPIGFDVGTQPTDDDAGFVLDDAGFPVAMDAAATQASTDSGVRPATDAGRPRPDSGVTTATDVPVVNPIDDVPVPPGCPTGPAPSAQAVPAFPGAEGFGATATGGRGGRVCFVTTLAASGGGSLQACLSATGARTVIFRVSGVINGQLALTQGNVTIAGQTSPGGIVVNGGMIGENVYDPNNCNNVIVRHMRFRNSGDDNIRLSGANRAILDHVSVAGARDENMEISRSQNITVQQSVIAEPIGEHYRYGGVLINYSKDRFPMGNLSLHHNVWNGVAGRLPEISCEENGDGAGVTNCSGHRLAIEVSNNVLFDVSDPVYYNRCTGVNEGNECSPSARDFSVDLNFIGNVLHRRSTVASGPMFAPEIGRGTANNVFWTDNLQVSGGRTSSATLAIVSRAARIAEPALSVGPAASLQAQLQRTAGALPHDPMDARLAGYLNAAVEDRPASWSGNNGIDRGDGLRLGFTTAPTPPADRDNDGMPDAWEAAHGLDPACPGAGLATLASRADNGVAGCTAGYTDLECYLNELADQRVAAAP